MKRLRRTAQWVGVVVATALVVALGVIGVQSATAAWRGPGFGTWPGSTIGWEGAFIAPDGSYVYCIVPGAANPTGTTTSGGVQTWITSNSPFGTSTISGDTAARINYIVTEMGQGADDYGAAAVSFAVKHLANPDALYKSSGWNGTHDLNAFIHYKLISLVGADTVAKIQYLTGSVLDRAWAVTAGSAEGSGWLDFTIDAGDDLLGTVTMHGTPATGTVSLVNGVFAATDSAGIAGMHEGVTYAVRGVPPADDGAGYRISGWGTFGSGYAPALHVWNTPGQQTAAGPGGNGTFDVWGQDDRDRSVEFAPFITTQVEQKYTPGGRFVDHVTFGTSQGRWPAFRDGSFATIEATAKVYRTATQPSEPTAEIPQDAEEIGELDLRTDPALGSSQPYRVESEWMLPGPGNYTAVWTISGAAQSAQTQAHLTGGADFHRQERFGERSQMSLVPNITSDAQKLAHKGGTATDTVIVADVLPAGGADISTVLHRVPDDVPVAAACTDDTVVWRSDVRHIDTTGRYTFTAPNIPAFGEYAWQHHAVDIDGDIIHTSECGIESEMTRAPMPSIDSRAPETVGFAGIVHDVAIVDGLVPIDGETFVTFALYRVSGTEDPVGACTDATFVGDTTDRPVMVTTAGEYVSPGIRVRESGIHYSIESLWWRDGDGGEPILLDAGECGRAHERTVVAEPTLSTNAVPQIGIGGEYWDEAIVGGLDEDAAATIVFDVFHNTVGQAPTCTAATRVATSRVDIIGSGTFRSPALTASVEGAQLWVATLEHTPEGAAEPVVLARGECGEANEVTMIVPLLPLTGGAAGWGAVLTAAAAVLMAGSSALFAASARRRKAAAAI